MVICFNNPCLALEEAATDPLAQVEDAKVIHLGMNVRTITVPNGKGQLISVPSTCKTVSLGNPAICDVVMLGTQDFLLVGKSPGETNVYVWLENDMKLESTIKVFDSTEALVELMEKILPYEKEIKISMAHNTVVLSGYVLKPTSVEDAQKIAEAYMAGRTSTASIDVKVVNMLKVKDEKQIMLEVRFAEVIRTNNKDMGFDWRYQGDAFGGPADFSFLDGGTPQYHGGTSSGLTMPSQNGSQGTSPGSYGWDNGQNSFSYGLDWIEAEGLGKIIAKPNLLVRNGEEASFLAGGEFPVPIQEEDAVRIEWKEFGVKLSFTPSIDERDNIHLDIIPEVSVLDFSEAAVSVNGFNIPALKTRRTETKVILREGQSFYVAGLISQSETDSFSKIPGIDTIPILGYFFRKKENTLSETELIVFVTPRIVTPVEMGITKSFDDAEQIKLMTNTVPVPFEQAHGDAIKNFMEQNEKPEKSLEEIRAEEIESEIARLEAEKQEQEEEKKRARKKKKVKKVVTEESVMETSSKKGKVSVDSSQPIDLSSDEVIEISNIELANEHKFADLANEVTENPTKKKRGLLRFFKRKKTEPIEKESIPDEVIANDLLAANKIVQEEAKDVVALDTNTTHMIASGTDFMSNTNTEITYFDDISDELHELSTLEG